MDKEVMDRELSHLRHRVGELEGWIMRVEKEVRAIREAPECQSEYSWATAARKIARWAGWPEDMEFDMHDITNNPAESILLWFGEDGCTEVLNECGDHVRVNPLHNVIRERGLQGEFANALQFETDPELDCEEAEDDVWWTLAVATPAQRTEALLKVINLEAR